MEALTVEQTCERFQMGRETVLQLFRRQGSPAYRTGEGAKSTWRVDDEDFKAYLTKLAEAYKG